MILRRGATGKGSTFLYISRKSGLPHLGWQSYFDVNLLLANLLWPGVRLPILFAEGAKRTGMELLILVQSLHDYKKSLASRCGGNGPVGGYVGGQLVTGMCASLLVLGRLRSLVSFLAVTVVVAGSSLPSVAQNSAITFTDSQPVPLASACGGAFAGHFHRGAKMDLVTTCTPSDFPGQGPFTAVMMNQGNGMFNSVEDVAIEGVASPVLAQDMNGDGVADLIVNQQFSSTIGVQLSIGDGTLKNPVYYAPLSVPAQAVFTAAAGGDFNGDGKNDVAIITTVFTVSTAVKSTNILTIFLNTGSGGLTQAGSYPLDSIAANENAPLLVAGHLDGDSKADLAVVYRSATGKTTPYFATANGAFRQGVSLQAGANPVAVAIGKFTSSGYGDLAVATKSGIVILLGSTSGTFTAPGTVAYPSPVAPFAAGAHLVLGDFDQDGVEDVAATEAGFVDVYWGSGEGKFTGPSRFNVPAYPVALVGADLTSTGRSDLISAGQDASLTVLTNVGHRSFRGAPNTHSPNATGMAAGDFDRDGKQDIAVVNTPTCKAPCNGAVTVFPGTGSTWFDAGKRYAIGMHGSAVAAGDVNGDGVLDLVVTDATAGDAADVSVLLGVKSGGFAAARNYTLGSLSNEAFLVDMNKDGKLDLVEAGGVALGKGDGTFAALKAFPGGIGFEQPYPTVFSTHLAIGDLNGDGIPDVAASWVQPGMSPFASQVFELIGDGKGNFTADQLYDANLLVQEVTAVAIGSLRKGGHPDIVVANNVANPSGGDLVNAVIFDGDGAGNFAENQATTASVDAGSIGAVAIADFNHDGITDIGVNSGDHFTVALGKGDGTFPTQGNPVFPISSGTQNNPQGNMAVADFNGDGWPDVVFTNDSGITRLYNQRVPRVSPGALQFAAGGSQVVTVENTVGYAESMSAAIPDGTQSPFRITADTCEGSLAAGAKCSVTVEYAASGSPGGDMLYIRANGMFVTTIALNGN